MRVWSGGPGREGYCRPAALVVMIALFVLAPLTAAPRRIMPLGDSRTTGPDSRNCYRLYLDRLMTAAGYSYDFVGSLRGAGPGNVVDSVFDNNHEGHWGWSTDYLLPRLKDFARSAQPDIVLALLGTTDILQENDTAETLETKLGRTILEIGATIDTFRSVNDSVIVLLTLLYPVSDVGFTAQIESLNVRIPALAAAMNTDRSPVIVVDLWTGFSRFGDLWDAYHSNKYGSIKVANKFLEALWPFFDSIPPSSSVRAVPGIPRSAPDEDARIRLPWMEIPTDGACVFSVMGRRIPRETGRSDAPVIIRDKSTFR